MLIKISTFIWERYGLESSDASTLDDRQGDLQGSLRELRTAGRIFLWYLDNLLLRLPKPDLPFADIYLFVLIHS